MTIAELEPSDNSIPAKRGPAKEPIRPTVALLVLSAVGCGLFIVGGQSALYGLAAMFYPTEMRVTGVGAAVAVGRIGSFAGPLFAGMLLSFGSSSAMVIGASIPLILMAMIAALLLVRKPKVQDATPVLKTAS